MPTQLSILWTAVPRMYDPATRTVTLSVSVSFRLPPSANEPSVKAVSDLLKEWPTTLKGYADGGRFQVALRRGNGTPQSLQASVAWPAPGSNDALSLPLWQAVMHVPADSRHPARHYASTYVRPKDDAVDEIVPIHSHPVLPVAATVDRYHADCFDAHATLNPDLRVAAPGSTTTRGWVAKLRAHDIFGALQWAAVPAKHASDSARSESDGQQRQKILTLTPRVPGTLTVDPVNTSRLAERDRYRLSDRPLETLAKEVNDAISDLHHDASTSLAMARTLEATPNERRDPSEVRKDFLRLKLSSSRVPARFRRKKPATPPPSPMDLEERLAHVRNHMSLWRPMGLVFDVQTTLPAGVSLSDFDQVRVNADLAPAQIEQPRLWTKYTLEAQTFRAVDDPATPWLRAGMLDVTHVHSLGPNVAVVAPKFGVTTSDVESAALKVLNYAAGEQRAGGMVLITNYESILSADPAGQRIVGNVPPGGRRLDDVFALTREQVGRMQEELFEDFTNEPVKRSHSNEVLHVDITAIGSPQERVLVWQLASGVPSFARRDTAPAQRASAGLGLIWDDRGMNLADRKRRRADLLAAEARGEDIVLSSSDLVFGYLPDVLPLKTRRWRSLTVRQEAYAPAVGLPIVHSRDRAEAPIRTLLGRATDRTEAQAANNPQLGPIDETVTEYLFHWTGWSLSVPSNKYWSSYAGPATSDPEVGNGDSLSATYAIGNNSLPALRFGQSYQMRVRLVDIAGGYHDCNGVPAALAGLVTEPTYYARYEPVGAPVVLINGRAAHRTGAGLHRLVVYDNVRGDRDERMLAPPRISIDLAETHGKFDVAPPSVDRSFLGARLRDDGCFPLMAPSGQVTAVPSNDTPDGWPCFLEPNATRPSIPYFPDPLAEQIGCEIETLDECRWSTRSDETHPLPRLQLYGHDGWPTARVVTLRLLGGDRAAATVKDNGRTLEITLPPAWSAQATLYAMPSGENAALLAEGAPRGRQRVSEVMDEGHPMLSVPQVVELVHAVQKPLSAPSVTLTEIDNTLNTTTHMMAFSITADLKSTSHVQLEAEWQEPNDDPERPITAAQGRDAPRCTVQLKLESWQLPALLRSERNTVSRRLTHDFHDGRHRVINVRATGFSRFRSYYAGDHDEQAFALQGAPCEVNVKATVRPKAPQIVYIVPSFEWEKKTDAALATTKSHRRGGLRVYMPRGWYSSGEGEKLGVVLWPHQTNPAIATDVGVGDVPDRLAQRITRWALDPTRDTLLASELPRLADFGSTDDVGSSVELPPETPSAPAQDPPQPAPVNPPPVDLVTVAAFTPTLDPDRGLWFADIPIGPAPADGAFVRLALVRYQSEAVDGAKISEVVLADFAQLVPDRAVTVTRTAARTLLVRVDGTALGSPMIGFGSMTELVVSVWRRCGDSNADALGELGWVEDPDAAITDEHDSLGAIYPRKSVTLNGTGPRRLVVMEYQRFTTDSPKPTDGVPARRMLYADVLHLR